MSSQKNDPPGFPALTALDDLMPSNPFVPVRTSERIQVLDGLRGLALMGIITANLWAFSGYAFLAPEQARQLPTYELDRLVYSGLHVLIDSKFSTIFSMLFGVGFAIQIGRAKEKGVAFGDYFVKRMGILLVIASLHAYVLWYGDIIRYYAVAGLTMLLVSRWSDRTLLRTGGLLVGVLTPVVFILNQVFAAPPAGGHPGEQILAAFGQGSYGEVLRMNWGIDDVRNFWQGSPVTIVSTTGKVMLGYWMGRIGLFTHPERYQPLLKRWYWWGLILGVPSSIVFWAVRSGLLALTPSLIWVPFVIASGMVLHSLFYISAFVRAFRNVHWQPLLRLFVPVGRMALTNYLIQTLVGVFLFYGYTPGPHWIGRVGPANLLLLGLVIYALQLVFSRWWLQTHEQGPVEWLWRNLSYIHYK